MLARHCDQTIRLSLALVNWSCAATACPAGIMSPISRGACEGLKLINPATLELLYQVQLDCAEPFDGRLP